MTPAGRHSAARSRDLVMSPRRKDPAVHAPRPFRAVAFVAVAAFVLGCVSAFGQS
jgi:hypothetical protein